MRKRPKLNSKFVQPAGDSVTWKIGSKQTTSICYANILYYGKKPKSVTLLTHEASFFDQEYYNHVLDIFAEANAIHKGFRVEEDLSLKIENFKDLFSKDKFKLYNLLCVYRYLNKYPNFIYNLVNYVDKTDFDFWSIFYYMSKNYINSPGHSMLYICKTETYYKGSFLSSVLARRVLTKKLKLDADGYSFFGQTLHNYVNQGKYNLNKKPKNPQDVFKKEFQKMYEPDYDFSAEFKI